jgi:hypothetical protein
VRLSVGILASVLLLPPVGRSMPLECSQEAPNFGTLPKGRDTTLRIVCRNTGKVPLLLESPGASCPCLQVQASRERLAGGESVELRLRLLTDDLSGKSRFYVAIPLHGAMEAAKILPVTVDVHPQVIAIPEFVDLGNIRLVGPHQVMILDTSGTPLELRHSRVRNGSVVVHVQTGQFIQRGGHWQVVQTRGAVQGYLLDIQPRPGNNQTVSDEVELEFENNTQRLIRLRVTGYTP